MMARFGRWQKRGLVPYWRQDERVSRAAYYSLLTLYAFIVAMPLWWMLSTSLDRLNSYGLPFPPRLFPRNPSLFNYLISLHNMNILTYLRNTLIITILSVSFNLFVASLAGFCLSKGTFPGKGPLLMLFLSNMMVPFESKLSPIYAIILSARLNDTHLGVVLPSVMTNAFAIFFLKKFCDDLPYELYEAAVVDGAAKFRIYAQIFLPLMGPALATVAVLTVIGSWNDLLWPLIVINKQSMYTIQIGLALFATYANRQMHPGVTTAMSLLSILPMGIFFLFLQRFIVQSVATTGIKQ